MQGCSVNYMLYMCVQHIYIKSASQPNLRRMGQELPDLVLEMLEMKWC